MSNLDRRGGYTPRRAREQRAYRMVVGGAAWLVQFTIAVVAATVAVVEHDIAVLAAAAVVVAVVVPVLHLGVLALDLGGVGHLTADHVAVGQRDREDVVGERGHRPCDLFAISDRFFKIKCYTLAFKN